MSQNEIKKPITQYISQKMQDFARYMLAKNTYVTKQELMQEFNITSERSVRDVISEMAKRIPIISTSDRKGYKIARTYQDLNQVEHCWKELDSRIDELEERKKPLIDFYNKCTKIKIREK